jgi:hypothetical protein
MSICSKFPAYVRGSACGLAATLGRLSGVSTGVWRNLKHPKLICPLYFRPQIVAPFAAQEFLAAKSDGVLWLVSLQSPASPLTPLNQDVFFLRQAVGGIWLAAIVLVFLPVEMRGRQAY